MEEIAVPQLVAIQAKGLQQVSAKSSLYVSFDKTEAKGIHMLDYI